MRLRFGRCFFRFNGRLIRATAERPRSIAARAIDAPVPDFRILGAAGGAVSSALVPPFVTAPHDSSLLFTAMSGFG